jgi:hypothetical protein
VPSETTALLRSIRQWLVVGVFLLGLGILTLAHTGWLLTATRILYWQSLVFSIAGVLGALVAGLAGVTLLSNRSAADSDDQPTE